MDVGAAVEDFLMHCLVHPHVAIHGPLCDYMWPYVLCKLHSESQCNLLHKLLQLLLSLSPGCPLSCEQLVSNISCILRSSFAALSPVAKELYFQEVNEQAKLEMLPQLCRLMHCLPGGLPEPVYRQLHPVLSLVVRTLRGLSGQSARLQCTLFETMAYLTGACASSWVQPQKLTSDMVSLTLAFLTSVSIPDLLNPESGTDLLAAFSWAVLFCTQHIQSISDADLVKLADILGCVCTESQAVHQQVCNFLQVVISKQIQSPHQELFYRHVVVIFHHLFQKQDWILMTEVLLTFKVVAQQSEFKNFEKLVPEARRELTGGFLQGSIFASALVKKCLQEHAMLHVDCVQQMCGKRIREDDRSREEWSKSVKRQKEQGDDLLGLREPLLSLQTQLRRVVSSRNPFAMKVSSDHPLRRTLQETRNLLDEIL